MRVTQTQDVQCAVRESMAGPARGEERRGEGRMLVERVQGLCVPPGLEVR